VAGRDIIVVQVKRPRLGMSLMEQALFSRELMKPFMPASIRTVALCGRDDSVMRPLAERYGIEVEIDDLRLARRYPDCSSPPHEQASQMDA
jgi:hypothetical protein